MSQTRPLVERDPADPVANAGPVTWAIETLQDALGSEGAGRPLIRVAGPARAGEVLPAGVALPAAPESFALVRTGDALIAAGSDVRGLVYALLELVDRVRLAPVGDVPTALRLPAPIVEERANAIRSIARLFTSDVEDKAWWYDRAFWRRYLTELATQRFNRFSLTLGLGYNFPRHVTDAYFYFAYPFLLDVPGYQVRATNVPAEERDRNLETLVFVGQEVKRRGLHFQLALWTHAYAWIDSPQANHTIEGLTPETHAAYCRAAVRRLLEAVPTIDGLTFRIHGESGVPEGSYDFWRQLFAGVKDAGRAVELDLHAKGIDQPTIDLALETGLPVVVSPKYWAEHMGLPYHQAAIRELERPARTPQGENRTFMGVSGGARRHTRYGYSDLLTEGRPYGVLFRIWPGTQRLLLWGDPVMAAGYGRDAHISGCQGVELCEPLSFKGRMGSGLPGNRLGYADDALLPEGGPASDWEKYRYTYRVWGRCIYNPRSEPDAWQRWPRHAFGAVGEEAAAALASASRILPLVTTAFHPSASNNRYWPEIYTTMPMAYGDGGEAAQPHPYRDTPSPRRFGTVSPLDPELFTAVDECADELVRGRRSGRYSPLDVAGWLDGAAQAAMRHLRTAEAQLAQHPSAEWRRWAADVAIQCALGRFFAAGLRAGVAYALYKRTGDPQYLRQALERYRTARAAWAEGAAQGRVYQDDLTFGRDPWLRGHWADRLPAIDADVAALQRELEQVADSGAEVHGAPGPLEAIQDTAPLAGRCRHAPPETFRPGEPLALELSVVQAEAPPGRTVAVELRYRHLNQAETYHALPMEGAAGRYRATIPATYTDSPYPLQYHFVLRTEGGRAWPYPGLAADLSNQPYFIIHQSGEA
jgi:hypothetical protein